MAAIDLHFHSTASDGCLPPEEVAARAIERGCERLALTDHDCTAGVAKAQAVAQAHGATFYTGVEISTTWHQKHNIHIVGLGFDLNNPILQAGLLSIRSGRVERAQKMADELEEKAGFKGVFAGAMQCAQNPEMIGRAHLARYLVQAGYVKDLRTVFRKFLVAGKPGYVPHQWASIEDAVSWIRAAGGVAVIAHPGRYDFGRTLNRRLIEEFKACGGQAIEIASGSHSLDEMHKFALLADEFELYASAGTDFHALGEGGRDVGQTADLPPICQPVWSILQPAI